MLTKSIEYLLVAIDHYKNIIKGSAIETQADRLSGSVSDICDAMNVFTQKFSNVDEAAEQEEQRPGHRVQLVHEAGNPTGKEQDFGYFFPTRPRW